MLGEMISQIPEEVYVMHSIDFDFHKGSNATVAIKNICDVYQTATEYRKCQRWFSNFRSDNFALSDSF